MTGLIANVVGAASVVYTPLADCKLIAQLSMSTAGNVTINGVASVYCPIGVTSLTIYGQGGQAIAFTLAAGQNLVLFVLEEI